MNMLALLGNAPVIVGVLSALSVRDATRARDQGADAIELRIDFVKEADLILEKLNGFVSQLDVPVIVTNRRKEEGGAFSGTEAERIDLLSSILDTVNVNAVDIELLSPSGGKQIVIEKAKSLHVPVICSFHDFNGMPSRSQLEAIVTRMYDEGASIAKIAVTPYTFEDALLLLELTDTLTQAGKAVTTIGMGAVGKHLRVVAPLYGSVLTYGYIEGEAAVAPGQFSIKELRSMLELLGVK